MDGKSEVGQRRRTWTSGQLAFALGEGEAGLDNLDTVWGDTKSLTSRTQGSSERGGV